MISDFEKSLAEWRGIYIITLLAQAIDWIGTGRIDYAVERLKESARELGFDLVKRQTAQEAHEAILAKRRAEDGQADETLGFR